MRIIEKGEKPLPNDIERIKKCKYCGTKFTYKESDLILDMFEEFCIECPICSQLLYPSIFDKKIIERENKK